MTHEEKIIEIYERLFKVEAKIDTLIESVNSLKTSFEKLRDRYNQEIDCVHDKLAQQSEQIIELKNLKKWVEIVTGTMVSILGVLMVYLIKLMLKV
jgi:regulator of replication initiation timing